MTQESRETVRNIIVDAHRVGENPRRTAQAIRDSIGLAPNQEQYVRNYRRALEQQNWSRALGYELSDGHADRTVRRLQRDGGGLSEQQVESMVERYRQNQITWRAEMVARTESAANVHAGVSEAMRQAVERGDVDADELVKEWIPGPRTKDARPAHHSRELLDQRPKVTEPFVLPGGVRMMWPGDAAGGAAETANCRCTFATTFKTTFKTVEKRRSTLGPFPGEGIYADVMRAAGRL